MLQPLDATAGLSRGPRPSIARVGPRVSLAGPSQHKSRVPRISGIGVFGGHKGPRPSALLAPLCEKEEVIGNCSMTQLTDKEIDERVRKCAYSLAFPLVC